MRHALFERNPLPMLVVDSSALVIDVNDAYLEMTRRTRAGVIGAFSVDFLHADDFAGAVEGLAALDVGERLVRQRRTHVRGDGTIVSVEAISSRVRVADEFVLLIQLIDVDDATDVTVEDDAAAEEILRPFGDIVCFHDITGAIRFATANFGKAIGRPPGWLYGRRLTDPELEPISPDGGPLTVDDDPVLEAIASGEDVVRTFGLRTTTGHVRWYSVRSGPVGSPQLPARSTLREVSDLIEAQAEARYLAAIVERELSDRADHDSLTGLKTRHVVTGTLEAHVTAHEPVSVVFIDLDGFRAINEKLGHVAGDEVLSAVADQLRALAPDGATLGRNGGDEFVAILDDPVAAERFAADVQRDSLTADPLPAVHASVGVAHRGTGDTSRSLLERADDAMYVAKRGTPRDR